MPSLCAITPLWRPCARRMRSSTERAPDSPLPPRRRRRRGSPRQRDHRRSARPRREDIGERIAAETSSNCADDTALHLRAGGGPRAQRPLRRRRATRPESCRTPSAVGTSESSSTSTEQSFSAMMLPPCSREPSPLLATKRSNSSSKRAARVPSAGCDDAVYPRETRS